MSDPLMLGAIDAGSNAIRVVVGALTATELVRVEAERVPVRLGTEVFTRGELPAATIDAAVAAFVRFREMFDRHGVTAYRAVATSAVRNAGNRDVLLHRLYHEARIELEVIEGEEEARLVRKSVLHALGKSAPAPRAILDLGGGSLEVNLRTVSGWHGISLPVGTVRLVESFGLTGAISEVEAGMVRRYAATMMRSVLPVGAVELGVAAVAGGNADALARIVGDPAAGGLPGFEVAALERMLPEILGASVDERMRRFTVRRDRAEVMGVAALILASVGRQLGIQRMVAPGVGVREAALMELAETAREQKVQVQGAAGKALLTGARTFANRVDHDTTHGEQVRLLARALFHQLRDLHGLGDDQLIALELAALLHDLGEVVNTRGHHKHSDYMIRNGRIPGLAADQRELIAVLARSHRKSAAEARRVIAESGLPKERRQDARRLAALLRLADSLDGGHRQRVQDLVCARVGETVVLDLVVRDGPSSEDGDLLRKADLFRDEFGVDVRVTVGKAIAALREPAVARPSTTPPTVPPLALPG